jgi:hypothetical protein
MSNHPNRLFFTLSINQAWFLYHVLRFVPGKSAGGLRKTLGDLLKAMPKVSGGK